MIIDCNRLWTQLVGVVYRLRRLPMVTNTPPPAPPVRDRGRNRPSS